MDNTKTKMVLLIDDDPLNNLLNTRIIQTHMDLNVIAYEDASEALLWLKQLPSAEFPEWIFLDINMPDMDGWDFLDALQELPCVHMQCRIVMLTSSIDIHDIDKADTYPVVHDFISKPLTIDKLDSIAAEMLG